MNTLVTGGHGLVGSSLTFGTGTLSLAGNVTHSGAFTQTFTATGNTNVTLPTSGTLSTLNGTEILTNKNVRMGVVNFGTAGNLVASNAGQIINITASPTIPQSTFTAGDVFMLVNDTASAIGITAGTGVTFYVSGIATTAGGTFNLSSKRVLIFYCVTPTLFYML